MGEKVSNKKKYHNKPLDRDYFKKKKNPNWDAKKKLTECCQQDIDHEVLNVFKKDDWKQIEDHIRQQLRDYPNTCLLYTSPSPRD